MDEFPHIAFQGVLRPSQADVVSIARQKLEEGKRRLHIVAPPGAGKTVLGLFLWAECVKTPALVLSPNSAIQAQWAARTDLFSTTDGPLKMGETVSTSPHKPALLTSLTYQSVTLPARDCADTDLAATSLWVERLLQDEHADSIEAANAWISDLRKRSPDYFRSRLSAYRKQVREQLAFEGRALDLLHESSRQTLDRLKEAGVGLVILDECHHLMGHWGRVLSAANELLDDPVVIGLTATPPDRSGQKPEDIQRYDDYFGAIDYEVPVPAVVKDGFLAPYQDLVYFVKPTASEMEFVAEVDANFRDLLRQLCEPRTADAITEVPTLPDWLFSTLESLELPAAKCETWREFEKRDPEFADAARIFLTACGRGLPDHAPPLGSMLERLLPLNRQSVADLQTDTLKVVLDRYIRHGLRRSNHPADRELCEQAIGRLRLLGIQVTETGSRPCASPVSRVLGYTHSKMHALVPILTRELALLESSLRAVVIADFEKSSAVSADVSHVLNEEAGGAVAAFRELVRDPVTNTLDPILMTGSTILVDHDMSDLFLSAARHWLQEKSLTVKLELVDEATFHDVKGSGRDWCPRVYIQMVTQLFQDGITRCLVGTRGLLGEGWDANRINVLIDLTTVTTSMTVNQLRGRSIRLDPLDQNKLANNWDVVCIAPEFARGLDDFHRLCRKHQTIFGVTDDGAIEKGIGHIHAGLAATDPDALHTAVEELNQNMLHRAGKRSEAREQWQVGEPYSGQRTRTIEARVEASQLSENMRPTIPGADAGWTDVTLGTAIARSLLRALRAIEEVSPAAHVEVTARHGGFVRAFLKGGSEDESKLFVDSFVELMSSFERPRYVVPFSVDVVKRKSMTGWLPGVLGRWFETREPELVRYHCVPAVFSRNKERATKFQDHWNDLVSDGDAVYCYQGAGLKLIQEAREKGQMPKTVPQVRDCFF